MRLKYIFLILLASLFQFTSANENGQENLKPFQFSNWPQDIPSQYYPIAIEAQALLGDGVAFKVMLNKKPTANFNYQHVHGVDKKIFDLNNSNFTKLGYTLIYHQVVQLMGGKSHQAIWVINETNT